MPETRKKYDREFREGVVPIVEETGKSIAQVAPDLGVNEGTVQLGCTPSPSPVKHASRAVVRDIEASALSLGRTRPSLRRTTRTSLGPTPRARYGRGSEDPASAPDAWTIYGHAARRP